MSSIQTIVVAVDFSEASEAAVDKAVDLAKALGAGIQVVHAFDLHVPMLNPHEIAIPEPYIEQSREAAASRLAVVVEKIKAAGLEAGSQLVEAPSARGIVDAAERVGADLIVMGTRGNSGLRHLLLGSVAERTLRLAHCSVMTVKSD
jgi:nucleotide-binding universal stress UspA family protein